jgi:hypothetical protein
VFSNKSLTEKEQKKHAGLVDNIDTLVDDVLAKNEDSLSDIKVKKDLFKDDFFRNVINKNPIRIAKNKLPVRKILAVVLILILLFVLIPASLPYLYGNNENPEVSISLVPQNVHDGDIMFLNVTVPSSYNIRSVDADMGGIEILSLSLADNSTENQLWQAIWTVHDAKPSDYFATIKTVDEKGTPYSSMIDWSVSSLDDVVNETGGAARTDTTIIGNESSNGTTPPANTGTNETQNNTVSSDLQIWDDADYQKRYVNDTITFYANYTSFNQSIKNATCLISFNEGGWTEPAVMSYNGGLYLYGRSFAKSGIYEYGVTCSAAGYENRTMLSNCEVFGGETGNNMTLPKPQPPTNFFATTYDQAQIDLSWTKGVGANNTYIVRKIDSYPIDRTDGTIVYNGTETSYSDTGLSQSTQYYYRAWSFAQGLINGTIFYQWSDDYANTNNRTNISQPSEIYENFWEEKTGKSGTIGSVKMNYTKAWKFFLNHSLWQLEGWNPQTQQWISEWNGENLNTWLSLKRTSIQNGKEQKIALTVTNHAPIATKFRFTFGVDLQIKDYVNRTGQYEYTMTYTANGRDFYFTFNWSDIVPLVQNGAIRVNHGVKNISGTPMYWFRITGNRNINAGQSFTLDPTYGLVADQTISSFEWDTHNGTKPDLIRLGTSQYYLISAKGGDAGGGNAWLYTIKVWNDNGAIQQSVVDSWNFYAASNAAVDSHLCHISGDYYAVMYRNGPYYIKTFKVWDTNGTFKKSVIDTLALSSIGASAVSFYGSFIHINNNIYSAVYKNVSNRGIIETFYIDSVGNIGNTVNDTVYFDTSCDYPYMTAIDSDTVVIVYDKNSDQDGWMQTYNISSTGDITNTNASWWEFDTINGVSPFIKKVGTNKFAIAYSGANSDGWLGTCTIADTGAITKSWISTFEFDEADCLYPYIFNVNGSVYGINYQGTSADGWVLTIGITSDGVIGTVYDRLEFDTADSIYYAPTISVTNQYYLIVYEGTNNDGWAKTFDIYINNPPTISNPSPADGVTGVSVTPQLSVNVSDIGDILSVNWSSNSSGSWAKFGTNQTIYSYGAISNSVVSSYEWNGSQGSYPCVLRLGESDYYLVFATTSGPLAWVYTLKVWNNNGTIRQSIVDSLQIEATWAGAYSQSLVHLSGDYYAVAYCDNFNKVRIKTFTADDADGQIGASTIGSVRLNSAYMSAHQRMVKVSGNMYAVVYVNNSLNATWLSSLYISPVGVYASTFNDTVLVNRTYGSFPNIMAIDDDTVVITYTGGGSDGYVCTYNISSTGDITDTSSSSWDFDTAQALQANICRVYGDTYAIAYEDSSGDGWIKTCAIIDTGAITKSWIDTYEFDKADGGYQTITPIGNNLFAITYQGTDFDGWMKILYISKTGDIASFEYDELEFDTADSVSYAPMASCGNDYYLIAYEGTGNDGWSCTVKIGNTTSKFGKISGPIDSWEYDEQEAVLQGLQGICRVNDTDIYISVAYGDTGSDDYGIARTFKVWGNNGTIQKSIIDTLTYDANAISYPYIFHINGTDKYVVGYQRSYIRYATFQVTEDGQIGASTIDTQASTHTFALSYPSFLQFTDNIYLAAYVNGSGNSHGEIESWWIDDDGTINNTILDWNCFNATFCMMPTMCKVDSDTFLIHYTSTANNGEFMISTWNITSSGVITDSRADQWAHEVDPYYYNQVRKIGTNIFAFTFLTIDNYCHTATVAISDAGAITKSYIDLLSIPVTSYSAWGVTSFIAYDPQVYDLGIMGCTFSGKIANEKDGYMFTWGINDEGLMTEIYDLWEFSTYFYPTHCNVIHLSDNNFLAIYRDIDNDGWIKTFKVYNETNSIILRQTNSNFSSSNAKYWWSINCTDGVNWANETYSFTTGEDSIKPSSSVTAITPYWKKTPPLTITATASDTGGSGLKNVTLYYYNSSNNATFYGPWNFGVVSNPWAGISWSFTFPKGVGYYRFYSRAADNDSNIEDVPLTNDTECGYDTTGPSSSVDAISPYNITSSPLTINATASDSLSGVKNVTLWYRYSNDNVSWWNTSWMYRKRLTINQTKVAGTLSNFPMLVNFTSEGDLASDAQDDGDDIVFTTNAGTKLNHEIESFNGVTGALSAWVNVTSLSSTTGTIIWMYYGNSACSSQQNGHGTWDSNFKAVYHLSETTGGSGAIKDSTSNHINGTNSSGVTFGQTGKISNSIKFDGASGKVDLGDPASFDSTYITVECWMKTSASVTVDARLVTVGTSATNKWALTVAATSPGTNHIAMSNSTASHVTPMTGSTLNNGAWHYIVGIRNPEKIYFNGSLQSSTLTDSWSFEANSKMGSRGTAQYYNGYLDEVRISSVTRNASWINTTYNTMKSPSTFLTKGGEEARSWNKWDNTSNPDAGSPWSWGFNFPSGRGYYQFCSIANDTAGNKEDAPATADTSCRYINDTTKPTSSVNAISPYWKKTSSLITVTASDTGGSGLKNVTLYYYNSSNNNTWYGPWNYGTDNDPWVSVSWSFAFPKGVGYYRFYSRAADNDSNIEDPPVTNDSKCAYETTAPSSSASTISPYWKISSPQNINGTASDTGGSGLKNSTLWYRYRADNASTWGSWTRWNNAGNPDTTPWSGIAWSFNFPSGAGNYEFYSIATDNATNAESAPGSADAKCGYDTTAPSSSVTAITPYWKKVATTIIATASDATSGVKNVTLYYRFSSNNASWGGWVSAGVDTAYPWSWSFSFTNGTGYYQFYSIATDNTTNAESAPGSADAICGYDNQKPQSSLVDGNISDKTVSTFEWDTVEGANANAVRLGTSQYYLIAAMGDGSQDGWVYTIKVFNNNATILQALVDSYEFDNSGDIEHPSVCHVSGDVYAVVYRDDGISNKVVTITVDDTNGHITHSIIDTLSLSYEGLFNDIIYVNGNIYAVTYMEMGSLSFDGFIETIYIDSAGNIGASVNDTVEFNASDGWHPRAIMLDSDTVAIVYCGGYSGLDGYICTYNISSTGDIGGVGNVKTDEWDFDTSEGKTPYICHISGNIYAIAYRDAANDGQIKTCTIDTNGKITKSWISTLEFDTADCQFPYIYPVSDGRLYSVAYQCTDEDGMIKTMNISSGGVIGPIIDSLEFDTIACYWYPNTIWISGNYYLIIYSGPDSASGSTYDGWACTATITTNGIPYWKTISPFTMNGTASDNGPSGLKNVTLWYRYRATNASGWGSWTNFGADTTPWSAISWSFTFPNGTGHYQFYSIAVDNVTNTESAPSGNGDASCGYNHIPTITNPGPSNASIDVSLTPQMNITVNDLDGNSMTIIWYSNSSGVWLEFGRNMTVNNGTYRQTNSNFSTPKTTYWWNITVTDGMQTNTTWYYFTTTTIPPTVITNTSTGVEETNATLHGYLSNDGGEESNVRFEYGTTTNYSNITGNQSKSSGQVFSRNIGGSELFEYYNTGDDALSDIFGVYWHAQTFTVGNVGYNEEFFITSVKLKMKRQLSPGNVTVGIRNVDGDGKPTGNDLTNGIIDGNTFTTDNSGAWYQINFTTPYQLSVGNTYAIVVRAEGTGFNRAELRCTSTPTYSGGQDCRSSDSGSTWDVQSLDNMFETYGYSIQFSPGTFYHYRAIANNSVGTSYGSDTAFLTKPEVPTNLNATVYNSTQINITWTKGTGANNTRIQRKTGSYPTSITDGNNVYNGTGTQFENTGLQEGTTYYYKAWSYTKWSTLQQWSDNNASDSSTTEAENTSIDVTPDIWTQGNVSIGSSNATTGYHFNLTNEGNVAVNVQIKADNATNATTGAEWKLKTTPGYNNFSLQFNRSDDVSWTNINTSYSTFVTNLAVYLWKTFDLKMIMATTSSTTDPMSFSFTFKSVVA